MLPNLYVNGFSCLTKDAQAEDFATFLATRSLRRAEQTSKNALLCAFRALAQAKIELTQTENMGLSVAMGAGALGSTLKFMDTIIEDGDELSSPTAFASSVHNSTALLLSMFLHIKGPCVITGQLDASFAGALLTAQQFLARQMCPQVLVVLTEDINPLLQEVLAKNPAAFEPFIYQPQSPAVRVAGALCVSSEPTPATQFVLGNIRLSRTNDLHEQAAEQIPVCSCAHSLLVLQKQLETRNAFQLREPFAGSILTLEGKPYVLA